MFKWINKAIVFTITLSSVYIFSDNILSILKPYLISGWVAYAQLFSFGFCIGFSGAFIVENLLKIFLYKLN